MKSPLEVVVAEITLGAGQFLVVPRQAPPEDIGRLDALCLIFGIGLILYDGTRPNDPSFQIRVRAARHKPDSFYVNQNIEVIANDLKL